MTTPVDPVASGDPLMTIDQAAEYLAIPKATLYTWRTRKPKSAPPGIKINGNMLRFRRSALDAWIDRQAESFDDDLAS